MESTHHMPSPPRRELSLDALAHRISEELETLAQLSADVQTALSMCDFAETTNPEAIRGLQGIDRITQALEDLGSLMNAVSGEISGDVKLHSVPILSRLRLHELIQNLDPEQTRVDSKLEADGDIQWF